MSPAPPLPEFVPHESASGELQVRWTPFEAETAWVLVLLRDPSPLTGEAFYAGVYDNDLIRVPAQAGSGALTSFVPTGRRVWLTLVARDAAGSPVDSPRLSVDLGQTAAAPEPPRLEGPVHHRSASGGHASLLDAPIPLVFAAADAAPPDLERLAKRVASQMGGGPAAPKAMAPSGGFGTQQKWYLTRLRLPSPAGPGETRVAVRQREFISPAAIDAWSVSPPDDVTVLPPECDGLIDASAELGATTFYAVLSRHDATAAWRPLPLAPLLPPFVGVAAPLIWGDATVRLAPALDARFVQLDASVQGGSLTLSDLPVALDLIQAAVRFLPSDDPLRLRAEARCERIKEAPKF